VDVLIVGVNYAPGRTGIAPYTSGLSQGLARRGHDVFVLTSRPHYPEWPVPPGFQLGGVEDAHGVRVRRLRQYIPASPSGLKRVAFEAAFGARLATSPWRAPDVVVCVSPALVSSAMAIARARLSRHRPAVGVVVQDLYTRGVSEAGLGGSGLAAAAARFEGGVLRACDGVSVIHDRFKRRLVDDLHASSERIAVIRTGHTSRHLRRSISLLRGVRWDGATRRLFCTPVPWGRSKAWRTSSRPLDSLIGPGRESGSCL
jgi:colanic acid biosynthesis glycosyl transferase WcaI